MNGYIAMVPRVVVVGEGWADFYLGHNLQLTNARNGYKQCSKFCQFGIQWNVRTEENLGGSRGLQVRVTSRSINADFEAIMKRN